MTLIWDEISRKAAEFSQEWSDSCYERGEAQSFYNAFFDVFGVKRRKVAKFEEHVKLLNDKSGYIDLLWPGVLIVEHKSAGKDLAKATKQVSDYIDALEDYEKPRYRLVCDFQRWELMDRESGSHVLFPLENLPNNIHAFGFVLGRQKPLYKVREELNVRAANLIGNLSHLLRESKYKEDELQKFLVRIVFCLFADYNGIFQPREIFRDFIDCNTEEDGSDLGKQIEEIFKILNTPRSKRDPQIDKYLNEFPYIDGDLFFLPLQIPDCDRSMRKCLLSACEFDWSKISPAIFGSLFQSVLNPRERKDRAVFFTSETNIQKVINGTFLERLTEELETIVRHRSVKLSALQSFQAKLAGFKILDPACGCGNFLAIAYRELRRLEIRVLLERQRLGDLHPDISLVDVHQCYGIEQSSYGAQIAKISLWMTDHLANIDLSEQLHLQYQRIPLNKKPDIRIGDALGIDWSSVVPRSGDILIIGNPPYKGAKVQSKKERKQIQSLAHLGGSGGTLDYVAGWLIKAGEFALPNTCIGFVATNSIVQGEQVAQIWPIVFQRLGLRIFFAHQTFQWRSEASNGPAVHVVIVGMRKKSDGDRSSCALYEYSSPDSQPVMRECKAISPYLIVADKLNDPELVVRETCVPINNLNKIIIGSKPIDGGYYIFSEKERTEFIRKNPAAEKHIRPYIGAEEFLYSINRYILYLPDTELNMFSRCKGIVERINAVRKYRLKQIGNRSKGKLIPGPPNKKFAATPRKFHVTRVPDKPFLVIPEVSSERREYIPIGWLEPPTIPSNLVKISLDAKPVEFGLLTSAMHMAWMRVIGGRLENRYRYSIGSVYNTFPLPPRIAVHELERCVRDILSARNQFEGLRLVDLYNPHLMPDKLRVAHKRLDKVVDKMYRDEPFINDEARVECLMGLYEKLVSDGAQ